MPLNFQLPVGLFLAIFAMYLFYAFNKRRKAVREDRRQELKSVRQQYLEMLLRKKKGDDSDHGDTERPV